MRARIVPASRGARWLGEGWQMFRAAPLGWLALVFVYIFATQIVALVPVLGVVIALLAVPGLTVGMMGAARVASRGGGLRINMLFEGFRIGLRDQLLLGAVYLACSVVVFFGMSLADEGGVLRGALAGRAPTEPPEAGDWLSAAFVFAALYAPVMAMFWFAPVLAAWHGMPAPKALFFSFFAAARNWRAFLVYGLAGVAALGLLTAIIFNVQRAQAGPQIVPTLVFLLLVVFIPVYYATAYASYRDIFPESGDQPAAP